MAVHPVQWTIYRWDRRIEAVVRVNDADHDGEAVHCANGGKVQTDADGEIPGRVEGRECTDFVHVDHGDTSYPNSTSILPTTILKQSFVDGAQYLLLFLSQGDHTSESKAALGIA